MRKCIISYIFVAMDSWVKCRCSIGVLVTGICFWLICEAQLCETGSVSHSLLTHLAGVCVSVLIVSMQLFELSTVSPTAVLLLHSAHGLRHMLSALHTDIPLTVSAEHRPIAHRALEMAHCGGKKEKEKTAVMRTHTSTTNCVRLSSVKSRRACAVDLLK